MPDTPPSLTSAPAVEITAPVPPALAHLMTAPALAFLADLHRQFDGTRHSLLARRAEAQAALDAGGSLDFLSETRALREGDWRVAEAPPDLRNRRVEITGPTDAKMLINALNSGASSFMADFEDANTPSWLNMLEGQNNLLQTNQGTISFEAADGRAYRLSEKVATLFVRPRGWHLSEKHVLVEGHRVSASLFDFGTYVFHNAGPLADHGKRPYFYLPKMQHHLEARLWNEVFDFAESRLGLARGTIRATVLIETLPAALQMEEILYELREHSGGLNAGRWDYIFSAIKTFQARPDSVLPDRQKVTMTVPFLRSYTDLLVKTCHRHGAHAIGGMAAFIPNRRDPEVTERSLAAVRTDKRREADDGFDGTWVAHPDLVAVAMQEFDGVLGDRDNQLERTRDDVSVTAADLLDFQSAGHDVSEAGLRYNLSVGIRYLTSWLSGTGAAAIFNLMEDMATAEISRSQVWQWLHHGAHLGDGRVVDDALVDRLEDEEAARFLAELTPAHPAAKLVPEARRLFHQVACSSPFVEFMTLPGYELLD